MTPERENALALLDGIFVGLLDEEELKLFEAAVKDGYAYRSYEGAGGLLGLGKVRLKI